MTWLCVGAKGPVSVNVYAHLCFSPVFGIASPRNKWDTADIFNLYSKSWHFSVSKLVNQTLVPNNTWFHNVQLMLQTEKKNELTILAKGFGQVWRKKCNILALYDIRLSVIEKNAATSMRQTWTHFSPVSVVVNIYFFCTDLWPAQSI